MKRFISISLILSIALMACPVFIPVSAAETSGNYFNVLDFTGYDSTYSNTFDVVGSTTVSYDLFPFLGHFSVYGIELTYSYVGVQPSITSFMLDNGAEYAVTSSSVGSNIVRVRGDLGGDSGSGFEITFDASITTVTIHSFNVYTVGVSDAPISGMMFAGNTQVSFDGLTASRITPSYGTTLQIRTDWWRNYDYADIWLTLSALGINSISAVLQETATGVKYNIPYEVNYLNTFFDSTQLRDYEIQLHLDFSGLDHANIGDAILRIEFQLDWTSSSNLSCTMNSFRGFVFTDSIESDLKWYQVFYSTFSSLLSNVYTRLFILDRNITNSFDGWFSQLESWISSQTKAITDKIDSVFDSSSLDQSQAEFDDALGSFDGSISENDEYFSSFDDVLNESGSIVSDSLPDSYQYLDANSAWGTILAFCWYPVPGFSEIILVFIGCLMLCNVILVKR